MSDAPQAEQAIYGKSYWEIVVHAFRKNWAARVAMWVCGAMIVVAILAPCLANDRPYLFVGTMPGEYRKSFSAVTRGAFMAILTSPTRMRAEAKKFEEKAATLNDFLKRLTDAENDRFYATYDRLRKRAESRPDTRGMWISRDVPVADVERELVLEQQEYPVAVAALEGELAGVQITAEQRTRKTARLAELKKALADLPGEREWMDATRLRIVRDMPRTYDELLRKSIDGLRFNLRQMADQLDATLAARTAEYATRVEKAVGTDFMTTTEDRRPALRAIIDELKVELDPAKVTLVPKTRWPLIASLHWLDAFFIVALLGTLLGFGPLTWVWLKRLKPMERRWSVTWTMALVPAVVVGSLWFLLHEPRFDTAPYKKALAPPAPDEPPAVVMTTSLWPPLRWRYDEVPELKIEKEEDRPPLAPSWSHPLGTDFLGRDLLSRMIWGARVSLSIGFVAEAIALFIGVVLGALAGYYRGWVDIVISRVIEVVICFPTFFLILAVVAFLPPSIYYVMLVLGLFGWMGIARLQRGEFLRLVNQDFVQSAVALGASRPRVMFRHILPNGLAPVLVAASFGIAGAMLTESGLSFLGFGVQEPETSWGQILFTGRTAALGGLAGQWWVFTIPGAAIFIAVTCYNLVGDGIRDAVDPRLKT